MLEFLKEKKVIIGIGLCLLALGGIYILNSNNEYKNVEESQEILANEDTKKNEENDNSEGEEFVIVHVAGAVKIPGVVKLKIGSRVEDAIEAAGGLTDDADISNINLAYIIEDGTKIKIPREGDIDGGISDGLTTEDTNTSSLNKKININLATQNELENLTGIGPSLAARIVEYRSKNGKFKNIEDIKNVAGIGDSKYENIKDKIMV